MAYEDRACVKYAGACGGQYRIFRLDDGTEVRGTEIDKATRERFIREARQKHYAEKQENDSEPVAGQPDEAQNTADKLARINNILEDVHEEQAQPIWTEDQKRGLAEIEIELMRIKKSVQRTNFQY